MRIIEDLLEAVAHMDCPVKRISIGLHWTVVESRYTGMAHTYKTGNKVELKSSGDLIGKRALELAERLRSWEYLEASLGLAALNSLIEPTGSSGNVFDSILDMAVGKKVTVIGKFPFNDQIAQVAERIYFLEMDPQKGEFPACACEEFIPLSDVVVITATTLINKTLPRLLELSAHATTIVLGPSTPLNEILFDYGATILAGVSVKDTNSLVSCVMQGVKSFQRIAGIEPLIRRRD